MASLIPLLVSAVPAALHEVSRFLHGSGLIGGASLSQAGIQEATDIYNSLLDELHSGQPGPVVMAIQMLPKADKSFIRQIVKRYPSKNARQTPAQYVASFPDTIEYRKRVQTPSQRAALERWRSFWNQYKADHPEEYEDALSERNGVKKLMRTVGVLYRKGRPPKPPRRESEYVELSGPAYLAETRDRAARARARAMELAPARLLAKERSRARRLQSRRDAAAERAAMLEDQFPLSPEM